MLQIDQAGDHKEAFAHLLYGVGDTGVDGDSSSGSAITATVAAEVLRHGRSRKVVVFKYKRRKNYRRKKGHRQAFTEVSIKDISA